MATARFVSFRFDLSSPGLGFRFVSFRNEIPAWRFRFVSFYSSLMGLLSVFVPFLFSKPLKNPVVVSLFFFLPVSSYALHNIHIPKSKLGLVNCGVSLFCPFFVRFAQKVNNVASSDGSTGYASSHSPYRKVRCTVFYAGDCCLLLRDLYFGCLNCHNGAG